MNDVVFWEQVKNIRNDKEFEELAISLFLYQSESVEIYNRFIKAIKRNINSVKSVSDIPFLPIEFFKNHDVIDTKLLPELFFTSSGTTGVNQSKHYVQNESIYKESILNGFKHFYGDPSKYVFLFLLPSYLEKGDSSLVYMAKVLMEESNNPSSGFYLDDYNKLSFELKQLHEEGKNIFLLGVSFALIDMFEKFPVQIPNAIIMETGGMKGRRNEIVREALHNFIKKNSGVSEVHSEYGMTELFSQAYSKKKGLFECPPWMKIFIQDIHDPFGFALQKQTGTISIMDLANIHSCAFIASRDLGRITVSGRIEVLGRLDNSDIRGCNLMID